MDKVVASPADAVADIPNGASVAVSGFGLSSGVPFSLLAALRQHGARDLCLVGNTVGGAVAGVIENDQVSRLIVSFVARPNIPPRTYNGKVAWTRSQMAEQAALLLPEGSYVNVGLGIPTLVAQYLEGRDVTLHGENGILGYGPPPPPDEVDYYVHDAGSSYVSVRPGAAYFDSVTAFEMVRSGKLDVVVLGAYQVDEAANFANWSTPEVVGGGIGGAMDMVVGGATVIVLMEHRDSRDRPKLVRSCTYPLTGAGCVDLVVTDLSVLCRRDGEFQIDTVAPGFTKEEVAALSEMHLAC